MTRRAFHTRLRSVARQVRRRPGLTVVAALLVLSLFQWAYLAQVGAINGQPISSVQASLIAASNWAPYLFLYAAVARLPGEVFSDVRSRLTTAVVLAPAVLTVLAVWESTAILRIVPSGHAVMTLLNAHLRSGLLENITSVAAVCGLVYFVRRQPAARPAPLIEVGDGSRRLQISSAEVLFVQAEDYYVRVHTQDRSWLIRRPLYDVLEELADFGFMRASRSAVLSVAKVQSLSRAEGGKLRAEFPNGQYVLIGRSYRKAVKEAWRQRS